MNKKPVKLFKEGETWSDILAININFAALFGVIEDG